MVLCDFLEICAQLIISLIFMHIINNGICHILLIHLCFVLMHSYETWYLLDFLLMQTRSLVGVVLMSVNDLGLPTHYTPIFYQKRIIPGLDAIVHVSGLHVVPIRTIITKLA